MSAKRSIKQKILLLVLTVSLVSILILSLVTFSQMSSVGGYASTDSRIALAQSGRDQMLESAQAKAEMSDEKLQQLLTDTTILRDVAQDIYKNPQLYTQRSPKLPDSANAGTVTVHQFFDSTYTETPEALDEVRMLANIQDFLEQLGRNNPAIAAGSTYVATESGIIFMADVESDKHAGDFRYDNIHSRPWYERAKRTGSLGWTDVMTDESGRGLGIVCSAPVYDKTGTLRAVVGVGALLTDLEDIVNTDVGENGYTYIINEKGSVILSRERGELAVSSLKTLQNADSTTSTVQTTLWDGGNEQIKAMVGEMLNSKSNVTTITVDGQEVFAAYAPISTLGWSFGAVIPTEEVLAPSIHLSMRITDTLHQSVMMMAVLSAVIIAGVILSGGILSRRISKPILELNEGVKVVAGGKLDYFIDIHTGDELQTLANSFNKMTRDLLDQMITLRLVTAEKERIGAELGVATHIQASMLPCIFPAFPGRPEFDIYATMQPAKEVGGDFYDFFLVDDNHLAMVMADVSGKGVPAALFMVIAKTLLKNCTQTGASPKAVLEKVNDQLCENNEAEMFVTVWLGILEISTGKMICANAGHEFPTVQRADGDFELIRDKHGFVLAGMEGSKYREYELTLGKGDRLFVYTDGVAEATNAADELYGTDRMIDALNRGGDTSCEVLLHHMKEDIDLFVGEAPQFDDITMLSLEMRGNPE